MTLKEKFTEPTKVPNAKGIFVEDLDAVNECIKIADEFAIDFYNWMRENDTPINSEKYFHYTDRDMLNAFKKEKGL